MKPTSRLFQFLLIFLLLCGGAPAVNANDAEIIADAVAVNPIAPDFLTAEPVVCGDPAEIYERSIGSSNEVDVYSLELAAGQLLTIDVTTGDNGQTLDTILFVYFDSDPTDEQYPETPIAWNDRSAELPLPNEDPYLEISAEAGGKYYLVIYDATSNLLTGDYILSLKCNDPSTNPDPVEPVKVGDLLGSTGLDIGSLVMINPADGTGTVRFSTVTGPIADIEYQYSSQSLLVAINNQPGAIVTIDPNTGNEGPVINVDGGSIVALEATEDILFGVYVESDFISGIDEFSLVAINQATAELVFLASLGQQPFPALAYHSTEKTMYGVVTGPQGAELVKIDLTSFAVDTIGSTGLGQVVALDFSQENVLYGVDLSGTLFYIPDLTTGHAEKIASIDVATEAVASASAAAGISGLTFVVGEPPVDDPIKTICSSSFTMETEAFSELADNKLSRFKVKSNPLHGAIGLFKFEGKANEIIHLRVYAEEEEPVESEEASLSSWLAKLWPDFKRKDRVFVVIRDAIPGVTFREKKKAELPLEMTDVLLSPVDGWYYLMVIRPLRRHHQVDYCLSLKSDDPESKAWETLTVAWPSSDGSEEDTTLTSAEANTVEEVQSDEVSDEGSLGSEDTIPADTTGVVPTLTASEPVGVIPDSSASVPVDEGSSQEVQAIEETAVDDTGEVALAEEPAAEPTEEPSVMGAPAIPEETTVDDTGEVAPAEEPAAEPTEASTS